MQRYLDNGKDNAKEWEAAALTTTFVFRHFNNDHWAVYFAAAKMRTLYKAWHNSMTRILTQIIFELASYKDTLDAEKNDPKKQSKPRIS